MRAADCSIWGACFHDLLGVDVDLVEADCIHPYIRDRVLSEAVQL